MENFLFETCFRRSERSLTFIIVIVSLKGRWKKVSGFFFRWREEEGLRGSVSSRKLASNREGEKGGDIIGGRDTIAAVVNGVRDRSEGSFERVEHIRDPRRGWSGQQSTGSRGHRWDELFGEQTCESHAIVHLQLDQDDQRPLA